MVRRCAWAGNMPEMILYHDGEWGVPLYDDNKIFEMLSLEGAQAGLSWATILKRREGYRVAFDKFDISKISKYKESKVKSLIQDNRIIRNQAKIRSTINNAKRVLDAKKEFGSFNNYVWDFVDHKPIINKFKSSSQCPSTTPISDSMTLDLKKRGFTFVGSTICYAFMQSIGMVNDHSTDCFRYNEL